MSVNLILSPHFCRQLRQRILVGSATLASAVLAVLVCLSVRPSPVPVLPKRLNVESCTERYTVALGRYSFFHTANIGKTDTALSNRTRQMHVGRLNAGAVAKIGGF